MLTRSSQKQSPVCLSESDQHEIDKVRARQETRAFISKMILRKWTIEGLFVEAKQFHGLRRARYRGLQKVSIQALMTAMAQNIKRIIKRLLDIYRDLGRYPYLRKEIFSPQNYPFYFKHTPRTFLYKPALAYNQLFQQTV
ncbi:MAG: transposase [Nitrosomonas sp.]|uniref:transposase n=1 Tax=Nitrosomonas sp. TaxID=42353 RepID=UPI0025D8C66E|nr:transposase [Nitrosomonas sp.]UJP02774.1 MAG: transposase [Nitrosomonas sp.]